MSLDASFNIRRLLAPDAAAISALFRSQSPDYARFFYAFESDEKTIGEILSAARKDVYAGVFWDEKLVSFFMLRGWDEGFEYPSLGVFVGEEYRGKRLMPLMLESAKVICKLSGVSKIIAKSHPDNAGLKNLLELGLCQVGVEESTGNTLWHIDV